MRISYDCVGLSAKLIFVYESLLKIVDDRRNFVKSTGILHTDA